MNIKINEKYEIENKVEDIQVENNSKLRGRDLIMPYKWPILVSIIVVLIYATIMYRHVIIRVNS